MVSTRWKFASAHARQVVESCPPEKSTRARSRMERTIRLHLQPRRSFVGHASTEVDRVANSALCGFEQRRQPGKGLAFRQGVRACKPRHREPGLPLVPAGEATRARLDQISPALLAWHGHDAPSQRSRYHTYGSLTKPP